MNEWKEIIETDNGFIDGVGTIIGGNHGVAPFGGSDEINKEYET